MKCSVAVLGLLFALPAAAGHPIRNGSFELRLSLGGGWQIVDALDGTARPRRDGDRLPLSLRPRGYRVLRLRHALQRLRRIQ